jgi:NAD-dependent histone deacetylase SIR2
MGISREFSRRVKLPQYNTVEDAVELLKKSKNIIVLTGAGVCFPDHAVGRPYH